MTLTQISQQLQIGERIISIYGDPVCDHAESQLLTAKKKEYIIPVDSPEVNVLIVNHRSRVRSVIITVKQVLLKGRDFGSPNGLIIDENSGLNGWLVHNVSGHDSSILFLLARPLHIGPDEELQAQLREQFPGAFEIQGEGHSQYDADKWRNKRRHLKKNQGRAV